MKFGSILLWSSVLSVLILALAGYYFDGQMAGGVSIGSQHADVVSSVRFALVHFENVGSGSVSLSGLRVGKGEFYDARYILPNKASDYRQSEFGRSFTLLPENIHLDSSASGLSLYSTGLSVDKDQLVDVTVSCTSSGKKLDCRLLFEDSRSSKTIVPTWNDSAGVPVASELSNLIESESLTLERQSAQHVPVLGLYSGQSANLVVDVIVDIANVGILANAAGFAAEEHFDVLANEKYGFAFTDGTTDLASHVQLLQSKIHPIAPLPDYSTQIPADFGESISSSGGVSLGSAVIGADVQLSGNARATESDKSAFALFYVPLTQPLARLSFTMDQLGRTGESAASGVYANRLQGSLDDQAQRLRTIYELEHGGLSGVEKVQRLANAIRWLDVHENLTRVFLKDEVKSGESIYAKDVSAKADGAAVVFQLNESSDFGDTINVTSDRLRAGSKPVQFYWNVVKASAADAGALNNTYSVIVSRTPLASED